MEKMTDIHTHAIKSDETVMAIRNLFPSQVQHFSESGFFSIGYHPWHICKETLERDIYTVEEFAEKPNVLAVGETGLDRIRGAVPELQKTVFIRHCQIASRLNKPLIVHCVKAHYEIIGLIKSYASRIPVLIHGFNAKPAIAKEYIRHSMFLSFGQSLLQRAGNATQALASLPENRFFLETDEGASDITEIYAAAAEIRGCPQHTLKQSLYVLFEQVFLNK
jgi:TatD DNase family protein